MKYDAMKYNLFSIVCRQNSKLPIWNEPMRKHTWIKRVKMILIGRVSRPIISLRGVSRWNNCCKRIFISHDSLVKRVNQPYQCTHSARVLKSSIIIGSKHVSSEHQFTKWKQKLFVAERNSYFVFLEAVYKMFLFRTECCTNIREPVGMKYTMLVKRMKGAINAPWKEKSRKNTTGIPAVWNCSHSRR